MWQLVIAAPVLIHGKFKEKMSIIASGAIYSLELNCSALNDISFYIAGSYKNKLGILLGANIPQWLKTDTLKYIT